MRHIPAVESATQRWRTGWLVSGFKAVPYMITPPSGLVIGLCVSGVPAIWTVLVVGLTAVWALAKMVASKTIKQQEMRVTAVRTEIPCCPAEGTSVEFKVVPSLSRKPVAFETLHFGKQHHPLTENLVLDTSGRELSINLESRLDLD